MLCRPKAESDAPSYIPVEARLTAVEMVVRDGLDDLVSTASHRHSTASRRHSTASQRSSTGRAPGAHNSFKPPPSADAVREKCTAVYRIVMPLPTFMARVLHAGGCSGGQPSPAADAVGIQAVVRAAGMGDAPVPSQDGRGLSAAPPSLFIRRLDNTSERASAD